MLKRGDIQKALEHIRSTESAQIEKQIAIAQIPAPPFQEETRAKALREEFLRLHLDDVEIDPAGNVLGVHKGQSPHLFVVAAHLDTVFPPGTDVTVKRNGSRLNGPGLVDDTRGLTGLLTIVDALQTGCNPDPSHAAFCCQRRRGGPWRPARRQVSAA